MSYKVNDSIRIAILIEDAEVPLDGGNALHVLHMVAGTTLTLPTLFFNFTDLLRVVPSMKLQDGALITVTVFGATQQTRYFRVSRWTRAPFGDGFSYSIEGYWNAPKYWLGTAEASVTGSSRSVIEKIASECGLTIWGKNTPTSDAMLWIPGNRTLGRFCREIARHGYASDTSHMVLGVDSLGALRYANVNANPKPTLSVGYLSNSRSGRFMVLSDFQPVNASGTNNRMAGYRHDRQVQTALGSIETSETSIELQPDSRFPLVSEQVRETQARGSISFSSVDFGNVHPRYERAKYQNSRYNMLNSVRGEFVFSFQTELEMIDNFLYVSPSELGNRDYDGEFTITAKVVYITGSVYQEKVVAVKNGLEN